MYSSKLLLIDILVFDVNTIIDLLLSNYHMSYMSHLNTNIISLLVQIKRDKRHIPSPPEHLYWQRMRECFAWGWEGGGREEGKIWQEVCQIFICM
jgi:hypothetical protein